MNNNNIILSKEAVVRQEESALLHNVEALVQKIEAINGSTIESFETQVKLSTEIIMVHGKAGNAINYSEAYPELFNKVFDCVKMSCDPGEYFVNGVKKFSIIHIYDNQMRAAANILCAYIKGKRIVTLLAQTQVGKTGVISAVIQTILNGYKVLAECGFYFGKNDSGNDVDVQNISEEDGITGSECRFQPWFMMAPSSNDLSKTAYDRFPSHTAQSVNFVKGCTTVTNGNSKKPIEENKLLTLIRNLFLAIDECHYAQNVNSTLDRFLKESYNVDFKSIILSDPDTLLENNAYILMVSATPYVMSALTGDAESDMQHMHITILEPPPGYIGVNYLLDNDFVHESFQLMHNQVGAFKSAVKLFVNNVLSNTRVNFFDQNNPMYFITRQRPGAGKNSESNYNNVILELKAIFSALNSQGIACQIVELNGKTDSNKLINSKYKASNSDHFFSKKPEIPTLIIIKGKFMQGVSLANEYICGVFDHYRDSKGSAETTVQSLIGRMTGINKKPVMIWTTKSDVEDHAEWIKNDFDLEKLPDGKGVILSNRAYTKGQKIPLLLDYSNLSQNIKDEIRTSNSTKRWELVINNILWPGVNGALPHYPHAHSKEDIEYIKNVVKENEYHNNLHNISGKESTQNYYNQIRQNVIDSKPTWRDVGTASSHKMALWIDTSQEELIITWRYLNQTVSNSKLPIPSESTYPGCLPLEKEQIKNELEMIQPIIGIDEIPVLPKVTKEVIKQHEDGRITGVNPYNFMRVKVA